MKHSDSTSTNLDNETILTSEIKDRTTEWFVPKVGPPMVRSLIGLLFLPYTAMVISFSVIGSMLAPKVLWNRVAAIVFIYFLGLGVGAHALDALGSKGVKPWGKVFARQRLWMLAFGSLITAYSIAGYYIFNGVPLLLVVALIEGFFVFSYNLEWFDAQFHSDAWFAFSWGFLPVVAGYIMQTNRVSLAALVSAASMALFSLIEVRVSRPYKELRRCKEALSPAEMRLVIRYEAILKNVSFGVIFLGGGLLLWRLMDFK